MIETYHADITEPDNLAALVGLGAASLITDPPYSPHVHDNATSVGTGGRGVRKRDFGFAALTPELRAAICKASRSVKRWTVAFSDIEGAHLWWDTMSAGGGRRKRTTKYPRLMRVSPWVRWSQPHLAGDRPPSGAELISMWHVRDAAHWSGPGSLIAFESDEPSEGATFHEKSLRGDEKFSCEKPLDLMLSLVAWFSDVGELVVDPCCGAGTTGRACQLLARYCVQLDADESAARRAEQRLSEPLADYEVERVKRWVESQRAWLAGAQPNTKGGRERWARAVADTDRVEERYEILRR
jgi:hypothetical protein